jgi:hypothetical protein
VGSLAHAQRLTADESRIEMAMEWVKTSRPVLKPWAETLNPSTPSASSTQGRGSLPPHQKLASVVDAAAAVAPAVWSVELSDKRLSPALQRWAGQAGWQLVWEAERDFLIDAALHVEGDFLFAIETAMRSLADTDYPLQAIANRKTHVLRIIRFQDMGTR